MEAREAFRRAEGQLSSRDPGGAMETLWSFLERRHVRDEELRRALELAEGALLELDRPRAAATIRWYRGELSGAASLVSDVPQDLARLAVAAGEHREAARHFERVGWLGHAAIQMELAGEQRAARVLWEQLASDTRLRDNPYVLGLVRFNLSRAAKALGDTDAARRERVASMHAVEAAADGFETLGQRERAFDCYQVLLTLGKEGAFENLAEGYLGCIRILTEDHLKYYVLQYYEDFTAIARERGELHAAGTLLREAASFCRRNRLPYERHYRHLAAECQEAAAQRLIDAGGMPEMAENALGAAIEGYNDLGLYSHVRAIYEKLATLPLSERRRARYARLARRLDGVADDTHERVPFPDYLRMDTAYPDVWRLDVVEWEQAGDPAETMGEVLSDSKTPEYIRRQAVLCRLRQLASGDAWRTPSNLVALARHLGSVGIYSGLAPLEVMVEHDDVAVRTAVLRATRQLYFKRSFGLVTRGLADSAESVRAEALAAVGALHFAHAFDPLQRIYRDSRVPAVREAALASIGKIPTLEAAELLLHALAHGSDGEQGQAAGLLRRADHPDVDALLRRAYLEESGALRDRMGELLRARGTRV